VGKKVNGTLVKRWLYDGQLRIVAELDGAGTLVSRFVYAEGINVPDYVVQGAATLRLITDYLGSPRLLIDAANGAIAGTMNHDAYGRVTQDTLSSLIPFGYAGGHYDAQTGLVRFGARDYDAEIGRWTTKDPIRFAALGSNLYEYALSNPVRYADPSGLDSVWEVALKKLFSETGKTTGKAVLLDDKPSPFTVKDSLESLVTAHPVGEATVGATKLGITSYENKPLGNLLVQVQFNKLDEIEHSPCHELGTRMLARRLKLSLFKMERKDAIGLMQWREQWSAPLEALRQRTTK
jgi:RHS repeat-associated protein